jgi:cytochrome c oxidase accessory protein FixG
VGLPWLRIDQKPALLLDFYNRHFVFFGFSFFSHDAPLLFFLVILLVLSIFTVTAIFGRLWCGWSCPQTVFLHSVFNKIEKRMLGSYGQRQKFFNSDETVSKKIKILTLYGVFFLVCWVLAHSFVAYFLGSDAVVSSILEGPLLHLKAFSILSAMTLVLFLNFAFFREKLCFYICPYGRFQNALIDSNTLVVFYDMLRGEPRGKLTAHNAEKGDCVDCKRCVTVCPVKIDIRQGFQQECIACGKCIDACNEVMHKIKRPTSLIRYETGDGKKITWKRFRLALYAGLIVIFMGAFIWALESRSKVDFNITRASGNPFSVRVQNGVRTFQNQFQIHMKNQTEMPLMVELQLSEVNQKEGYTLLSSAQQVQLQPEADFKTSAFIEINETDFKSEQSDLQLQLKFKDQSLVRPLKFIRVE